MGSPKSAGSSIRNNNVNEEQRFKNSKKLRELMRKLSNVSGGREGYVSYIPSRVIYKYIFEGVSLNQAINDIEKKIKYYKNINTILNHTEKMKGNEFNKFIFNRLNKGVINFAVAQKLGRERLKRAKAKEPKSPSRIEKRNKYANMLNNLPRNEAKNKLEKLYRGHRINLGTYEYLTRMIQKPRKFPPFVKLLSVTKKELKKKKGNNR
jgi:hypothetical protein